jgi:hypothetical protein
MSPSFVQVRINNVRFTRWPSSPSNADIHLADQTIRDDWGNGSKVNRESSPQFAVEVLLHVRRRFYADIENDGKQIFTLLL